MRTTHQIRRNRQYLAQYRAGTLQRIAMGVLAAATILIAVSPLFFL